MTQKVLKVGPSAAVIIPKKSLEELGIRIGDEVRVEVRPERKEVSIKPAKKLSKENANIARLTLNFINRYHRDLEVLARK